MKARAASTKTANMVSPPTWLPMHTPVTDYYFSGFAQSVDLALAWFMASESDHAGQVQHEKPDA